ncbi:MAG: AAA family ATPase, partial [Opitutaceae bacterium]|nr:AAA family ATPase [Opitutaceae bacterium]
DPRSGPGPAPDLGAYPFTVPSLGGFDALEITTPVTFFVGENGSGKSTLLEAVALAARLPPATGAPLEHDETLDAVRPLARALRLGWRPRTHYGFFLRAEDFFNFARETRRRAESMDEMAERFKDDPRVRGYMFAQKQALTSRYGEDLHAMSHGESFLKFFQSRCVPGGLYLIDEPEAALSPQRQLAFLSLMKALVEEGAAQFIVATHSPLLLAYPDARLLCFDDGRLAETAYDDLPHVQLTRNFLASPERFLRGFCGPLPPPPHTHTRTHTHTPTRLTRRSPPSPGLPGETPGKARETRALPGPQDPDHGLRTPDFAHRTIPGVSRYLDRILDYVAIWRFMSPPVGRARGTGGKKAATPPQPAQDAGDPRGGPDARR